MSENQDRANILRTFKGPKSGPRQTAETEAAQALREVAARKGLAALDAWNARTRAWVAGGKAGPL